MNVQNFEQLAAYLDGEKLSAKFDMGVFSENEGDWRNQHTCGAVGCVIGQAPYAGLGEKGLSETWESYSHRVFGLEPWSNKWKWCFSSAWDGVDNTAKGAARRIRHLIKCGLPYNWEHQMYGAETITY